MAPICWMTAKDLMQQYDKAHLPLEYTEPRNNAEARKKRGRPKKTDDVKLNAGALQPEEAPTRRRGRPRKNLQ